MKIPLWKARDGNINIKVEHKEKALHKTKRVVENTY